MWPLETTLEKGTLTVDSQSLNIYNGPYAFHFIILERTLSWLENISLAQVRRVGYTCRICQIRKQVRCFFYHPRQTGSEFYLIIVQPDMSLLEAEHIWHTDSIDSGLPTVKLWYDHKPTREKCPAFVNTIHMSSVERNTDRNVQHVTFPSSRKASGINRTVFQHSTTVIAWDTLSGDHRMLYQMY